MNNVIGRVGGAGGGKPVDRLGRTGKRRREKSGNGWMDAHELRRKTD